MRPLPGADWTVREWLGQVGSGGPDAREAQFPRRLSLAGAGGCWLGWSGLRRLGWVLSVPGWRLRAEIPRGLRTVAEQPGLGFAGLLRRLRAEAGLTQEELAEAASLSPRSVSDLERGIHRTAHRDTAGLLADALGLAEPVRALFVAAARGRRPATEVLAARQGQATGASALQNNLPAQLSRFIGRDRELAEVRALVESSRLVTLTGAGGSGKTRLSLQVAAELLDGSGDGVWLAELAAATDQDAVPAAISRALRLAADPGRPGLEALLDALALQDALIVLDNCEHLVGGCAKTAEAVVRRLTRADPKRDHRQLGVLDRRGRTAAWTGAKCIDQALHQVGEGYSCQGNMLASASVVPAMARAFESSRGTLGARLMLALKAGLREGGDKRGIESSALVVVHSEPWLPLGAGDRWVDLRVDRHPRPVAELDRLRRLDEADTRRYLAQRTAALRKRRKGR